MAALRGDRVSGVRHRGGDTLAKVQKRVRSLGVVAAQRVAQEAAPAITRDALASFDSGRTATGGPRPSGVRGPVSLVRTGRTRATVRFVANGTVMRAVLGTRYARYLIGRFGILPSGAIPTAWKATIGEIVKRTLDASWKAAA